jgi:DNA (cytosine-5)-methyltransferase 1
MRQLSGVEAQEELSPTLLAAMGESGNNKPCVAYSFDSLASNSMKSSNPHSGCREVDIAKTLDTTDPNPSKNQGGIAIVEPVTHTAIIDSIGGQAERGWMGKVAPTLKATHYKSAPCIVESQPVIIHQHAQSDSWTLEKDNIVQTIPAAMGMGGGHGPLVVEPAPVICLQGNGIDRADTAGCNGKGWKEDTCYTLNTIDRPAVAYLASGKETVGTLMANAGTKLWLGNQEAFSGDYHIVEERPAVHYAVAYPVELHDFIADHNADAPHQQDQLQAADGVARPLVAATHGAASHHTKTVIYDPPRYIVRRLTPTECARLQGFADCWGHVEKKDNLTDEEFRFWLEVRNTHAAINGKKVHDYTEKQMLTWYNKLWTDSAEYKMWGNGIALPPALYCLQGIVDALNKPEESDDEWML